ncbi:hypothetical protein [Streptococcus vestibularis]|nr:hypothetical protein [Streptococcus vestibularis]
MTGLALSLHFSAYPTIVITIATLMTLAREVYFTHFLYKPNQKILAEIIY